MPAQYLLSIYIIISGVNASAVFAFELLRCFRGKCQCNLLLMNYYIISGVNRRAVFCS